MMTGHAVKDEWRDTIARWRAERDAYKARAAFQWKEKARLNKAKRWLDALEALSLYHEYRDAAAKLDQEIRAAKEAGHV